MSPVISELKDNVLWLTLNRGEKYNAFDETLLQHLLHQLTEAQQNPNVRVIVLKGQGKHFCAGADLHWMQRMADYTEEENEADAKLLAKTMHQLYISQKPTIAMVHGAAYGGGAGLIAACDIAFAAVNATFCFSEVKLGLIPAVISPYVIEAIGARATTWLFMTAEPFNATQAQALQLVHHCVEEENLLAYTTKQAAHLTTLPPQALYDSKALVRDIKNKDLDETLIPHTARLIAKKRISREAQQQLRAFLTRKT